MKPAAGKLRLLAMLAVLSFAIFSLLGGCARTAPPLEMTTVPDVTGLSRQEAREALHQAGLEVGQERESYDDSIPAGEVISTSPPSGDELGQGSSVDLLTSRGPEIATIPSLLGMAEADALATLQAQGFQAEVVHSYSESAGAGLVCGMDPASGATAARGSKIVLTISLGSAYVTCGTCGGNGTVTTSATCPDCGGTGVCYT